ncbi:MAG: protein-disulfide reductase DsbD domain-containing protein [Opitutaceae bacterium]
MKYISAAGAGLLLLVQAMMPAARGQVQASLVSSESAVQSGRPFTVAVHFIHDPGWHTYWLNPGTGIATSLEWKLPPGWKAGAIQWPVPEVITDDKGDVTGNGYEGDLLLPVTLTPPADLRPGSSVTLAATADFLMCHDVCKPGEESVSLSLPVSAGAPAPDPTWAPRISAVVDRLPREDPSWSLSATRRGKLVTLTATPRSAGAHPPKSPHFFSEDNLIAYEEPQGIEIAGGGVTLNLSVSLEAPANARRILGVLASQDGWGPGGALPGLRVDIPLKDGSGQAAGAPGIGPSGGQTVSGAGAAGGLGATLLLAFFGGLILNLMPCVFPVLGIKVLGFVNQSGNERRKVVLHGLVYAAGVVLSFWALVGILIALRAGGDQLGWGFQLQSPAFVFGLAAVMLVFALNLSGVFEVNLSITSGLQSKTGFGGSFFTGVLATVVATPCSAPFLAPTLGAALTLSTIESFLVFTVIAIGLSTPYLLLSIFPAAVRVLPRPGAWMETFKQFMAFPLYATAGYLVWVIAGQVSESGLLDALIGLVLIAMGAWAYGKWHNVGATPGRARFGLIAAVVLFALGGWTGWPQGPAPGDVTWEKWSPETLKSLRAGGRIVYVDFTARWCATCQANKGVVFHSPEILRTFREKNIATLRGDWTNRDPQISAELARYNRDAVPFDLIWFPGKSDPVILPEILTPGIVLSALKSVD